MEPLSGDDPTQVGGYQVRARLGAGGMGWVYLAYRPDGWPVALKVVRPEFGADPVFRERFRREVDAARRVHGLYTAQVLDADPDARPPWLVTAYVPGPSLHQAVAQYGPMPPATVFALMAGVAEALQAIHAAGVVHRDLKPSNVLLAPDGPRVIDFGIARAAEAATITQDGMRIGSPQFMVPEQILGLPPTPALDVFALGHLAAYAALGRSPFAAEDAAAAVARILSQPPDLEYCPPPLRELIERCLHKDPHARPSPADVVAACRAYQSSPREAWLPSALMGALAQYAAPAPPMQYAPNAAPLPPTLTAPSPTQATAGVYIQRSTLVRASIAAVVIAALIALGVVLLPKIGNAGSAAPPAATTSTTGARSQAAGGGGNGSSSGGGSTSAASTSQSAASGIDPCVIGSWKGVNQIVPAVVGEPVQLTGPGPQQAVLKQDGTGSISYGSGVTFSARALTEVVTGGGTFSYQTSNGSLLFSNQQGSGTQTLYVNGIRAAAGPLTGATSVKYVCSGNSLKLYSPTGTGSTELTRTSS